MEQKGYFRVNANWRRGSECLDILLMVEDDFDENTLFQMLLDNGINCRMRQIVDGTEALEYLRNQDRDLSGQFIILLDINSARVKGHDFLANLREDPILRRLVVFVLSTSSEKDDVNAAYDRNVAGYILRTDSGIENLQIFQFLDAYRRLVTLSNMMAP